MTQKDLFNKLKIIEKYTIKDKFSETDNGQREDSYEYLIKYAKEDNWKGFNDLLVEFLFEFACMRRLPELDELDEKDSEDEIIINFIYTEICQSTDSD